MDVFTYLQRLCRKHGVSGGQYKFGEIRSDPGSRLSLWCILKQPCFKNDMPGMLTSSDSYEICEFIGLDKFSKSLAREKAATDAVLFMSKLYAEDPFDYT